MQYVAIKTAHKMTFTAAHFHVTAAQFVINCTIKYALSAIEFKILAIKQVPSFLGHPVENVLKYTSIFATRRCCDRCC